MKQTELSRRHFALLAGTVGAAAPLHVVAAAPQTAGAVIQRIKEALPGEWPEAGPDGLKAGDPNIVVKGIATTAMATMDVLKQAARAGANLIITYEPTFFGRQDKPAPMTPSGVGRDALGGGVSPDDPIYKAKRNFIDSNGLVVFRLRNHWQARKENEMTTGLAESLGWTRFRVTPNDALYRIPTATAEEVVAHIRAKLKLRGGIRAVGDRNARVQRVLLYPGSMTPPVIWQRYSETDLIVTGEVREWENTHYAADIFTAGEKRGLITLGRVASEDPGMRACAAWLRTVAPDVSAQWISAGDLYWRAA